MSFSNGVVGAMRCLGAIINSIFACIGSDFEAVIYFSIVLCSVVTMIGFAVRFHNK